MILGTRRQAKLESEDYQVYAADLEEYELEDVKEILEKIGKSPRQQYESAFPEIGKILDALDTMITARRRAERKAREEAEWEAHVARVKAEPPMTPEEEREWEARWKDLNQKLGLHLPPWEGDLDYMRQRKGAA